MLGKTNFNYITESLDIYFKRINALNNFEVSIIQDIKNANKMDIKMRIEEESNKLLNIIDFNDFVVLLDEKGKELDSRGFASLIEQKQNQSIKKICFIISGAYGSSDTLKNKVNYQLSLSKMTFSHQLVRVIFAEQLYRALSIINKLPYHH